MNISFLFLLIVGIIVLLAVLGALVVIGLSVYRSQMKKRQSIKAPGQALDEEQAAEITSTWNLLNH